MSGKSPLAASAEQRDGLRRLAISTNRARAILLSLSGWKSAAIGEVFGVREDTVRDWRSTFMRDGVAGIERHPAPGCSPVKAEAALAVANELFAAPDRLARRRISGTNGRSLPAPVLDDGAHLDDMCRCPCQGDEPK